MARKAKKHDTDQDAGGAADATHVRISAQRDGYRRAGMAHSKVGAVHPIDSFTPDQLAMLRGDPRLTLQFVAGDTD
ncbi:MAG: hypothetical protein GEU91_14155 [Rhizobiales bacterium]|nr:hypothetical protein [Hyphomicrobiales bacterium]